MVDAYRIIRIRASPRPVGPWWWSAWWWVTRASCMAATYARCR